MTISKDLFLALLAMDSYDRGYDGALNISGTLIGNTNIITDISLGVDRRLGQIGGGELVCYRRMR